MDAYYKRERPVYYAEQFDPQANEFPKNVFKDRNGYHVSDYVFGDIDPGMWIVRMDKDRGANWVLSPEEFAQQYEPALPDDAAAADLKQPRTILPAGTVIHYKGWPFELLHPVTVFGILPPEGETTKPVYSAEDDEDDDMGPVAADGVDPDALSEALLGAVTAMLIAQDSLLSVVNPGFIQSLQEELARDGQLRTMLPGYLRYCQGEKMTTIRGRQVVSIQQVLPDKPLPAGVRPWPDENGLRPRDTSLGYCDTATPFPSRVHVFAGDWIITDIEGGCHVFTAAEYEEAQWLHSWRPGEADSSDGEWDDEDGEDWDD